MKTTELENRLKKELLRRHRRPKTIQTYKHYLRQLSRFFPEIPAEDISMDQIKEYFDFLVNRRRLSSETINVAKTALRFLYNEVLYKDHAISSLRFPKRKRATPEILSSREIVAIITGAKNQKHRSILSVMYSGGLDISDTLNLRVADVDLSTKTVNVPVSQNRGTRSVLLHEYVSRELETYIQVYKPTKWLFEGARPGVQPCVNTIQKAFTHILKDVGIQKGVSLRSLRYAHIKHLEQQGLPLESILKDLGLRSSDSLQFYRNVKVKDVSLENPFDVIQAASTAQIPYSQIGHGRDSVNIDLSFMANDGLRGILERDLAELNIIISQGVENTTKMCMILCGSIAETMLLDSLLQHEKEALTVVAALFKKTSGNLEDWELHELVTVASHLSPPLLPDDTSKSATQLRQWRNLIHPGRELKDTRKGIKPSKARAHNAVAFVKFIAEELGRP